MKYVNELNTISDFPDDFLKELDSFFVNTNLSKDDRSKLVSIIKKNFYSAKFSTTDINDGK
jgi:hypothetical protein